MLAVVLLIGSLLLSYFIVRKGVHHGILDADESRRARERNLRLRDSVRASATAADQPSDGE